MQFITFVFSPSNLGLYSNNIDNTCCRASFAFFALDLVIGPPSSSSGSLSLLIVTPPSLKLPTSFHPSQAWIKFSTGQCVKDAPMYSYHLLLGWAWLHFKGLNLDERSPYLRHEGHKMKLKFMTPRQVSKDQHRLKEKIEKERIEKEEIETSEGREHEEKEKEVKRKMMENLFVIVFSSTVCDVI